MLIDIELVPEGVASRKQVENLNAAFDRLSARLVDKIALPEPVTGFSASNLIRVYLQSHLRRMLQLTEASFTEFFDGRGVVAIMCARGLYEGLATVLDFEKELKILLEGGDLNAIFQFTKEKSHATKNSGLDHQNGQSKSHRQECDDNGGQAQANPGQHSRRI